ncbi:MAG TPA: isoprenylcysteine carboxylmethyltransferase family protein [Vicinamibacterales bacterium]|nr:isoprenylcysteine carboxylmethyltransferase family protein [Vicinamibacterales bacterium]
MRIAAGLAVVFALMLLETRRSRRAERSLRARGAVEPPGDVFAWMRVAYPLAFAVPAVEGWLRPAAPATMWGLGLLMFLSAKAVKYWAVATLGDRWSFRVLVLPGEPRVLRGPYRFLSHPNYVGVAGEIGGAALFTGGLVSGALFTILFGWLMLRRVRIEERALTAAVRGQSTS